MCAWCFYQTEPQQHSAQTTLGKSNWNAPALGISTCLILAAGQQLPGMSPVGGFEVWVCLVLDWSFVFWNCSQVDGSSPSPSPLSPPLLPFSIFYKIYEAQPGNYFIYCVAHTSFSWKTFRIRTSQPLNWKHNILLKDNFSFFLCESRQ